MMGEVAHRAAVVGYRLLLGLLAACGHRKSQGWLRMRRGSFNRLAAAAEQLPGSTRWMGIHCASVGEYEQARPVMEEWRKRHPQDAFLLTFFSPSGWDAFHRKPLPGWRANDHVEALPLDTPRAVRTFIKALHKGDGTMALRGMLFTKYDVWPELVGSLDRARVPVGIFGAHVLAGRWPFRKGGGFHRMAWNAMAMVAVQTNSSVQPLKDVGVNALVLGDPRYDRVLDAAAQTVHDAELERWIAGRPCAVVGSAWAAEWEVARRAWRPGRCAIVVPHEWTPEGIAKEGARWAAHGAQPVVWSAHRSEHARGPLPEGDVLMVDAMGELLGLYAVAQVAVVGGGFGAGVHNTLEPAAHGVQILVGPQVARFHEVGELRAAGALHVCSTSQALERALDAAWDKRVESVEAGARARAVAEANRGAGARIVSAWENALAAAEGSRV